MVGALSLSFAPALAFSAGPPAFTYTPSSMRPVVMMTPVETELALKQEALDAILAKIDPAQLELTLDVLKKQVEIAQLREIYISKTATDVPIIQAPTQAAESIMPAIAPVAPAPPVVEAPAALAQAAEIMTPQFQSLPATEPFVKASETIIAPPAMEQAAAVAASAPADDFQLPIMAFGIAFTVFPAAVIGISKILENPPQAPPAPKAVPSMPTAGGATGGIDLGSRSADEIFISAINNLGTSPTGWLFGKPSALYSNLPPPAPPAAPPASPPPTSLQVDGVGSVSPTATPTATPANNPAEKAARERAEDEARGRKL